MMLNWPNYPMSRPQEIRTDLDEGIDRKDLSLLRTRFLSVNDGRLERTRQAMSPRQQQVLTLLPLLFDTNHPILPGYVSNATPCGLSGFKPDARLIAEAQRLSRSFSHKPHRGQRNEAIHGLFLMGSLGTVAQNEQSDLDVWVCHQPDLDPAALGELRRKCDLLEAWAATQGTEAHFFLIDPARFTQGRGAGPLTSDDCGTTQHYLLLDEFYRTAIWLGGRTPLWWLVPAYEEHRYDLYVETLIRKRFIRSDEVLDLGHLGDIPAGEFLGAGLWQLYKGIESPYKSVLKLLLTEVYASEHPDVQCIALRYKQAVYANRLDLDELDPYIVVYRRLEEYLRDRGDQQRLELIRRCLYIKVNKPLSRPPRNRRKSWQRLLLERLTEEWGWDARQLAMLDSRSRWKEGQVSLERRALVNELTYGYRFLSQFARQMQVVSPMDSHDLGILGRRLYAAFERKAGKVEFINPGISPDMAEESLTLVLHTDRDGDRQWILLRGNLNALEWRNYAPLKRSRDLVPLLAWCHRNGVIDGGTRISLHPGDSDLREAELSGLLGSLQQVLPVPLGTVPEQALLASSVPKKVLLLINVGVDPLPQHSLLNVHIATGRTDSLGYAGARENLVVSIDQLTLNSWNELMVSRYDGTDALLDCLRDYLDALPAEGALPELHVRCLCRNRAPLIARRVEELFADAQASLASSPNSRYLLQVRQHYHLIDLVPGQVRHASLPDLPALLDHLGEGRAAYSPIHLDRHANEVNDLGVILPAGQPNCLQVFYRIRGEQAELSVLDELNALWRQHLPFKDELTLLTPLQRFLQSILYRRNAMQPLTDNGRGPTMEILYHQILPAQGDLPLRLERRSAPPARVSDPFYDVQAIIEPGDRGRTQVSLYCNHREFSELEYGPDLFATVARHILAQRRTRERYPCYITDLDLSGMLGDGPAQTVQYLRYKTRLEAALNQALEQQALDPY